MIDIQSVKRIVIKVGTSTLTYENGKLNLRHIEALCRVIADLKNRGIEVVLVTSAAVGVGVARLGLTRRPRELRLKQAAAAVGQCALMNTYAKLFEEYGYVIAQVLLTKDIVDHEERHKNVHNTFFSLLEMGVIPIVNENDTVATEELVFGDNDTLSALVADICSAQLLIILSDIDGLYEADPKKNPNAKFVPVVHELTDKIKKAAGGTGSAFASGGMETKIQAAEIATQNGIAMILMNGNNMNAIYDVFDGKAVGTLFMPKPKEK